MAAVCNLAGPLLLGAAVANTIASFAEVEPAQTAVVLMAASLVGAPTSTTQVVSSPVVGVAAAAVATSAGTW